MQRTASPLSKEQETRVKIRDDIRAADNREIALQLISDIDGNDSLPIIIQIIEDIRHLNERDIEGLLQKFLTSSELQTLINEQKKDSDGEERDIFAKYGDDVVQHFKDSSKTKTVSLDVDSVRKFIHKMLESIFDKHKKLKFSRTLSEDQQALINDLKMDVFLISIGTVYKRADWEQHQDPFEVVKKYAGPAVKGFFSGVKPRDLIESRYKMVNILCQETIIPKDNLIALYDELGLWLEGLYLRTDKLYTADCRDDKGNVKKDGSGNYLPRKDDNQDASLYSFGLTKYYMSQYYKNMSVTIRNALFKCPADKRLFYKPPVTVPKPKVDAPSAPKLDVVPAPVLEIKAASEGEAKAVEAATLPVEQPRVVRLAAEQPAPVIREVEKKESVAADAHTLFRSVSLPRAHAEGLEKNTAILQSQPRPVSIPVSTVDDKVVSLERQMSQSSSLSSGGIFYRKLSSHRTKPDDDKITQLHRALFTDAQQVLMDGEVEDLDFAVNELRLVVQAYINNAGYLRKNKNLDIAQKIISVIDDVSVKPREKLCTVISQRPMLKDRHSKDLLPDIDKKLLDLFDNLIENHDNGLQVHVKVQVGAGFK